ncbi:MAG: hypothetical protein PHQ47_02090, partial [Candidatus Portnoybacteria bacterium]|nr:hypothetical protein [Candidatus Portnoybacteria bacterium]
NSNLKLDFKGGEDTFFKAVCIIEKKDGTNEIKSISISGGQGIGFVENLENVDSVILIPVSQKKSTGFNSIESFNQFSFVATLTDEIINPVIEPEPSLASSFPNGSLIRAAGDYKVYIVNDGYKRWIQTPEIFGFYGHFKWASIIEVTPQEKDALKNSWMVRADGDYKVYEINADGTKHWLNMTPQKFTQTGHKWDMVYVINTRERDWYKTGVEVK